MRRLLLAAIAVAATAVVVVTTAIAATAATPAATEPAPSGPTPSIFAGQTMSGGALPCSTQSDGVRVCHGYDNGMSGPDLRLKSFDGSPLEVYVILPPGSGSGPYPVIVQSHGWGSSAGGPNNTEFYGPTADQWARDGYAVLQLTARGFGDSCGRTAQESESPAYYAAVCKNGYIRLDDERYEAHDVQWALGLLADERVLAPGHIGVTGESYGGGVSLELATLKDRVYDASTGKLVPWTSPNGTPLSITAAAPVIPWSDLVYSLMPNGRTLDDQVTSPTADLSPIGVEKQSFVTGLYALGTESGYYAAPGTNDQADLTAWYAAINAGEPYDTPLDQQLVTQIAEYHSPYYLLDGAYGTPTEPPAPLLIANGFTDDLFPVDEAVRYYNLDRSLYPSDSISLLDGDFGHQRAANKPGDEALLSSAIQTFFNYWLKRVGARPPASATATIETCPTTLASGGPFTAPSWAALHPGNVDFSSAAPQTILSSAGNPAIAKAIDPILAGNDPCGTVTATDQGPGVASYRLTAATGNGYTLLGSPTVTAKLNVTGEYAFIAARLWDVDLASNTETLVARGLYRINSASPDGRQTFQLHPGAWHFAAGHLAKLELLGQDSPYARTSNGQFSITVSGLHLRLPVHDLPRSSPAVR